MLSDIKRKTLPAISRLVGLSAYSVIDDITIPLMFEVYKPKECLKAGDEFRTKPQIAAQMVRELKSLGFKFKIVLADTAYGESESTFISVLDELELEYVMAIRRDHGVWMPEGSRVNCHRWRRFERIFSNGESEERFIRELVFGKRRTSQLRLVMQPFIFFNLLKPWLQVFPIPRLSLGFPELIAIMNQLHGVVPRASSVGE